jgi:hypothetical protein
VAGPVGPPARLGIVPPGQRVFAKDPASGRTATGTRPLRWGRLREGSAPAVVRSRGTRPGCRLRLGPSNHRTVNVR